MRNELTASRYVNRRLVTTGAGLMVLGGLIGFAGMAISGGALAVAARRRIREMDVSPRELATQTWQQARKATLAGASAWRDAGNGR